MKHTLDQLMVLMTRQLKRRGYFPGNETEILLRLGEEVGEVMEAVREGQSNEALGYELVDVLWNIMRLAQLKGINLEAAFFEKLRLNEERPLDPYQQDRAA